MGGGPGDDEIVDQHVPVPEAEAEELVSKVNQMIDQLDLVITDRASGQANKLVAWDAPNRVGWEEDFHYSQTDLFTAIDSLQWFRTRIDGVLEAIREHNSSVVPGEGGVGGGGGGDW
jgi:hypothetical protein